MPASLNEYRKNTQNLFQTIKYALNLLSHEMKNYVVYFEIYGKKMKATVPAFNEEGAKQIVQSQLKIHKVVRKEIEDIGNTFSDIIDLLTKKK